MGLDMNLYKKTYVKNWQHMRPEELHKITIKRGGLVRKDIKPERISYIVEDIGYWRKANQIHKWFVDNVQDGNDDCGTYYVSAEKLLELKELCETVISKSKLVEGDVINGQTFKDGKLVPIVERGMVIEDPSVAKELLPNEAGFFFGSTEYDKWYLDDLKETVKIIDEALDDDADGDFEYSSSW